MAMSVYEELCEMFGKKAVDLSIEQAKGNYQCTCGMKNADRCQAKVHKKKARKRLAERTPESQK